MVAIWAKIKKKFQPCMWMILKWALFICDFMEDFSSGAVHLQIEEIQPLLSMIPVPIDWWTHVVLFQVKWFISKSKNEIPKLEHWLSIIYGSRSSQIMIVYQYSPIHVRLIINVLHFRKINRSACMQCLYKFLQCWWCNYWIEVHCF